MNASSFTWLELQAKQIFAGNNRVPLTFYSVGEVQVDFPYTHYLPVCVDHQVVTAANMSEWTGYL